MGRSDAVPRERKASVCGTRFAPGLSMESFTQFLCTDGCPGLIEGLWAGLVTVGLGALVTLLVAVNAIDEEAKTKALVILIAGGLATLAAARFVGVAVWRMLDPGSLG